MEFLSYLHQLRFLYHKKEITNKPGSRLPDSSITGLDSESVLKPWPESSLLEQENDLLLARKGTCLIFSIPEIGF